MHRIFTYVAFSWLTLGGTGHFLADVLSQYLRGKRAAGPETSLYYGLNSAYAEGQILLGVMGLLLARQAPLVLDTWPAVTLCLAATVAWLAISTLFMEYWEPKFVIVVFSVLYLAAAASA